MRRTIITVVLFAIAAVALVFAWPSLAGTARVPRAGDWVPATDPGVLLVLRQGTRVESCGLGEDHHYVDLHCAGPTGYLTVATFAYPERNGVLGQQEEVAIGSMNCKFGAPQLTSESSLGGGFRDGGHLRVEAQHEDGRKSALILAPPPSLLAGATTPWQPLAAVLHLDILLEWRRLPGQLEVRRRALPAANGPPRWGAGQLLLGPSRASFVAAEDGEVAAVACSGKGATAATANVLIEIGEEAGGIVTNFTVK